MTEFASSPLRRSVFREEETALSRYIVMVDDNSLTVRKIASRLLEREGY